ncbi:GNAT family N-acetyltransferase [Thermobifida halotolerans]|uniref:GNAT family N-acetyltransferase n=1 Tax=Thermobifida halotolerans TaxID=483545 RepID=A0A399G1P2_9ACTN|nr:GNAT family N-acetyltransferase [Thermobifida halotolerans]UOE20493.1 GNAT family N-acetyltransferase [Thermobifida halotolerans]
MLVREARHDEMPRIGDLRVATYVGQGLLTPDSPYVPVLRALGTSGVGEVLVAVDGDDILGTVTLRPFQRDSEITVSADEAEIRALAVAPYAQRRGVGGLLLRAAIERAVCAHVAHLVLSTQPIMVAARRLYVSEGFVRLPERDWSPQPGMPLLTYGLRLDRASRD